MRNFKYQNEYALYPIIQYIPSSSEYKKPFLDSLRQSSSKYYRVGKLAGSNYFYKYLDLESAILCLQNRNVRFVEPTLWPDQYEGRFYRADYSNVMPKGAQYDSFVYACCFTNKQNNEAAWKIYTYGKTGLGSLCVEFKIRRMLFRRQLATIPNSYIYEGVVKYLYQNDVDNLHKKTLKTKSGSSTPNTLYNKYFVPFDKNKYINLLTIKRDSFEHEHEVRFLIEPLTQKAKAVRHVKRGKTEYGEDFFVKINWLDVLEEIRIEDSCSITEYNIFKDVITSVIDCSGKSPVEMKVLKQKLEPKRYPIYGKRLKVKIE